MSKTGITYYLLASFTLFACQRQAEVDKAATMTVSKDTLIQSQWLHESMPEASHLVTSEKFFLVIKKDTSDFNCLVNKLKENRKYTFQISITSGYSTYAQRLRELQKLVPEINRKYPIDSLQSIFLGRLIYYGDLAIGITQAYHRHYSESTIVSTKHYPSIASFLLKTQLAEDFNKILRPYGVAIQNISVEKIFFADKKELLTLGRVSSPTDSIPEKILDCLIWMEIDRIKAEPSPH